MILRMITCLLGLSASVWTSSAFAQAVSGPVQALRQAAPEQVPATRSYMLQGQVLDAAGLPLPGATVMIQGTKRIHATNADGYYAIAAYQPSHTLLISLAGYSETALAVQHGVPALVTLAPLPGTRIKQGGAPARQNSGGAPGQPVGAGRYVTRRLLLTPRTA